MLHEAEVAASAEEAPEEEEDEVCVRLCVS